MTIRTRRALFWLAAILLMLGLVGLVSSVLLPFVVGILVAYFLDPAADKLEEYGCSRSLATALITGGFFATVAIVLGILVPLLYDQLTALLKNIPDYINSFQQHYGEKLGEVLKRIDNAPAPAEMGEQAVGASQAILATTGKVAASLWESGVAFLNLLSLIFISPVVAFYMLRDYDRMVEKVDGWLPRNHAATIRHLLHQMDGMLSAFIRGVSNVCLIMAVFYATGFSLVGLDFGLLIGLGTGLATFIPFVGPLTGYTAAVAVAYFQFDADVGQIAMVGAVCGVGQLIESNFLTPMLVGGKVNLHPVWVIFGLLAGGSLFGFVGVLLAVPVTAVLGVLVRFALQEYMKSDYYKGGKKPKGARA